MTPLPLKTLQLQFSECMKNAQTKHPVLALVKQSPLVSASTRMNVYQEGYWLRIVESFQADFPRVADILGEEKFEEAVRECLNELPSRFWTLAEVSGGFHKFISRKCREWRLPFLGVLAEFEWHQTRLFYDAPPAPFDVQKLANTPGSDLDKFFVRLNPTMLVMKAPWRLDLDKPKRTTSIQSFMIYRAFDGVKARRYSQLEARLLRYLAQDRTVAELTHYLERQRLKPELISSLFSEWVRQQIVV